jgi:hypothetical protein
MRVKSSIALLAALMAALLAPPALADSQSSQKRVITLSILAAGAENDMRITALEDGSASINIPDVGQFSFAVSFRKGDDKTVVVTISDPSTKPATELAKIDAPVAGKPVQSRTKPSFEIRVVSVK